MFCKRTQRPASYLRMRSSFLRFSLASGTCTKLTNSQAPALLSPTQVGVSSIQNSSTCTSSLESGVLTSYTGKRSRANTHNHKDSRRALTLKAHTTHLTVFGLAVNTSASISTRFARTGIKKIGGFILRRFYPSMRHSANIPLTPGGTNGAAGNHIHLVSVQRVGPPRHSQHG